METHLKMVCCKKYKSNLLEIIQHLESRNCYCYSCGERWIDMFQEIVETVWPKGILEFESNGIKYNTSGAPKLVGGYDDYCSLHLSRKYPSIITSVQNSSGEVFSVGDEVEWKGERFIINNFEISDDKIKAFTSWLNNSRGSYPIDRITKFTPKTFTKAEIEKALNSPFIGRIGRTEFKRQLGI